MLDQRIIIVLNGPPSVGKDTLARYLKDHGYQHTEMKYRLNQLCAEIANIPLRQWMTRSTDRALKEQPWDLLGGLSTRQFQIKVSEEWIKPIFGDRYFGDAAAKYLREQRHQFLWVFSDGGFASEIEALREVGTVFLARLHRQGFAFTEGNDSRNYLHNVAHYEKDFTLCPGNPKEDARLINEWVVIQWMLAYG